MEVGGEHTFIRVEDRMTNYYLESPAGWTTQESNFSIQVGQDLVIES